MKIIFLDFDGPLSNCRVLLHGGGFLDFDPVATGILENICAASGAKIVCTSSRTYAGSPESYRETKGLFTQAGLDVRHLHADWSCYTGIRKRADDIRRWLERHPGVTHYAIVDDEPVDLPHVIRVDEREGMLMKDVDALVSLLDLDVGDAFRHASTKRFDEGQFRLEFGPFEQSYNEAVRREAAAPAP